MNPKYLLLILAFVFWGGCEDEKVDCTALTTASANADSAYSNALADDPMGDHSALCVVLLNFYQAGLDGGCVEFYQQEMDTLNLSCL